jgi:hypothetical protein
MAEPTGTTDPPNPPPPPANDPPKQFTQEHLNDAAGRARNEGRQTAERDILAKLGITNIDEATASLTRLKEIEDKNKDELTKAAEKATKAEADLEALKGSHGVATLNTRIERAVLTKLLGEEGTKLLDKAAIIRRLIDVDAKIEDKELTAAVEELAKTMPALFAVEGAGQGGDGNGGRAPARPAPAPGRPAPGGGSGNPTPKEAARILLHERHPRLPRKD